jgi:8-oxo-dGTP diphosphatase
MERSAIFLPPERFERLASYKCSDIDVNGGTAHGKLFVARDVPTERLLITEGTLLVAAPAELVCLQSRLSPIRKAGIKAFLESGKY